MCAARKSSFSRPGRGQGGPVEAVDLQRDPALGERERSGGGGGKDGGRKDAACEQAYSIEHG